MFVAELSFRPTGTAILDPTTVEEAIVDLLTSLRMSGQIRGREWPILYANGRYSVQILLPGADALEDHHHNSYVRRSLEGLAQAHLAAPAITVGPDIDNSVCDCADSLDYILYTNHRLLDSPLHCGECFGAVPLYRIPPLRDEGYFDLLTWETQYQSCDDLRGLSGSLLDAAVRHELFDLDSDLVRQGRALCETIAQETGIDVYYALYRYGPEPSSAERDWPCPSCGKPWYEAEGWHRFDFVCHRCLLVSTKRTEAG